MVEINRKTIVPDRGEIILMDFSPTLGHEQSGLRPGLVITRRASNEFNGLALICPITTQVKNRPFESPLSPGLKTKGVVLADQIGSFDCAARNIEIIEKISPKDFSNVQELLRLLIF